MNPLRGNSPGWRYQTYGSGHGPYNRLRSYDHFTDTYKHGSTVEHQSRLRRAHDQGTKRGHSTSGALPTAVSVSSGHSQSNSMQPTTDCFPVRWNHYLRESLRATWNVVKKVGHYSLDVNFLVKWDASGLKYFHPGKCSSSTNLFQGFCEKAFDEKEQLQTKYNNSHPISQLISWMKENRHTIGRDVDFVVKHSLLKSILLSPFDGRSWEIEAVLHDGVVYLDRCNKGKFVHEQDKSYSKQLKEFQYSGGAFEKAVTRPGNTVSSQSERLYSVLYCELGEASFVHYRTCNKPHLSFIISAEIDAVCGDEHLALEDLNNYVEIKTTPPRKYGEREQKMFQPPMRVFDWWVHCYLAGIPKIFIGERSASGWLVRTTLSPAFSIPGITRIYDKQQPCMDFFLALFKWIKNTITKEGAVYQFSFNRVNGPFVRCKQSEPDDKHFLDLFQSGEDNSFVSE